MNKLKRIITLILVSLMFACIPFASISANTKESKNVSVNKEELKSALKDKYLDSKKIDNGKVKPSMYTTSKYIKINSPKDKAVYYKKEKINTSVTFKDPNDGRERYVAFFVMRESDGAFVDEYYAENPIKKGTSQTKKKTINTGASRYKNGKYILVAMSIAFDENAEEADEDDIEIASVGFTVRTLKAPTKLKAKAGKKKVALTFKKATGGKKYEIYRSAKKTKGYKKIKTTTSAKFTDKKAKKGKRYYYKVRTVRGGVKSSFTKPIRSKKVK